MNTGNVAHPGSFQGPYPYEESVWARRGTWGAIILGAITGFAITFILMAFGTAAGMAAGMGAAAADEHSVDTPTTQHEPGAPATTQEERDVMKGAGLISAAWLIITALVSGLIGGWVAGRVAQVYAADTNILGLITWALGILLLVAVVTLGASSVLSGLAPAAGQAAQEAPPQVDKETGSAALTAAGLAVWGFFFSLLVGLGATMFGARKGMKRRMRIYPRTTTGYVAP